MTRLAEALFELGIEGEVTLAGRWVMLKGERCSVYVAEVAWGTLYFTWCADPCAQTVEAYRSPSAAIRAGLQRAARLREEQDNT